MGMKLPFNMYQKKLEVNDIMINFVKNFYF